ncbi:MAG TPA: pitrilysin family protein, partial [Thermoanaerobaculia bacterium]|nr:pitrilysin family protein [Thermoanaerobaculia bacterium]
MTSSGKPRKKLEVGITLSSANAHHCILIRMQLRLLSFLLGLLFLPACLFAAGEDPVFSVQRTRLANGMEVWIKPRANTRAVDVRLVVRVGFRDEKPLDSGLSHLLEHMLFKGTRSHTEIELNRMLQSKGAYDNGETWPEYTFYEVNIIDRYFPLALGWLREITQEPLLLPAALRDARKDVYSEQQGHYPRILERIFQTGIFQPLPIRLGDVLFPNANVSERIIANLDDIDANRLRAHLKRYYVPGNMGLIVVGNVDPAEILREAQAAFGSLTPAPVDRGDGLPHLAPRRIEGEIHTLFFPPAGQMTEIWRGFWTAGLSDPDRHVLRLIAAHLDRRAFEEVRLKRALAYSVGAATYDLSDIGLFYLHANATRGSDEEKTVKRLFDGLLTRVRQDGLTTDELREAKDMMTGRQVRRYENNANLAALYQELYLSTPYGTPIENGFDRIEAITNTDVLRVAGKTFVDRNGFRAAARPPMT